VSFNNNNSYLNSKEFFPVVQCRLNWKDIVEVLVSGNKSFIKATYGNAFFQEQKNQIFRSYNELIIRHFKNIVLETNFTYRKFESMDQGTHNSYALLNGGVTYVFLKENKGQLKLFFYDILNKNASLSRSISENFVTFTTINTLNQYFSVSFFYDIRGLRLNKVGGKERLLLF
jgi:hypothetical protein